MRILGVGDCNELGDMYLRLGTRGHEVKVHVRDPASCDVMAGMLTRSDDWQRELAWVRAAGDEGLIVFETASDGALQDELRRRGYHVVGGSALGDRLEQDRVAGQAMLRELGLQTLPTHAFTSFDAAIDFVSQTRARYVFKLNGASATTTRNYVGQRGDGADVIATLQRERGRWRNSDDKSTPSFVLMDYADGVEVGVGAYFNGKQFVTPANLDWEHKRFCAGDLGELTGEMGTLVTYRSADRLFDATLARLAPRLAAAGHVGYVNLNLIVNEQGIWPLEFTCRFGYPGFAILDALQVDGWDIVLNDLIAQRPSLRTHGGYAVGVVLTVPPFPYAHGYEELGKGAPILFDPQFAAGDSDGVHLAEVALHDEQLVTSGSIGYIAVVTGRGATVEVAQRSAYRIARQIVIPNVRYRNDIGDKFVRTDRARLQALGWLL